MSKLYIVPTPVGNLEDITFRALSVLNDADVILAEDTRKTKILLSHYRISTGMISYHKFNEHRIVDQIVSRIAQGETMALVSDAGTPGISDPGFLITRACIENNIPVECLPGATAFIPALVNSGFPTDRFCFEGFLPVKKGRTKRLKMLAAESRTIVLYEAPFRLIKTLEQLAEYFSRETQISVSRELTKIHEETFRGSIEETIEYFGRKEIKGEVVIILHPGS